MKKFIELAKWLFSKPSRVLILGVSIALILAANSGGSFTFGKLSCQKEKAVEVEFKK